MLWKFLPLEEVDVLNPAPVCYVFPYPSRGRSVWFFLSRYSSNLLSPSSVDRSMKLSRKSQYSAQGCAMSCAISLTIGIIQIIYHCTMSVPFGTQMLFCLILIMVICPLSLLLFCSLTSPHRVRFENTVEIHCSIPGWSSP